MNAATATAPTNRAELLAAIRGLQIPSLSAIEEEIARRRSLWNPQAGPQTMAYNSEADILGYGGAAGGGKSDLAIGLALTQHRRSIIFRREGEQTRDLFDRAREVVGDRGDVNRTLKLISNLPGDRQVEFDGIKNIDDWRKHRGRARDLMVFDEGTEFEEIMIRSLIAWNRTTIDKQRTRVVIPFNPPGAKKGQWIIGFFGPWLDLKHPDPAEPGELRWFTTIKGVDVQLADKSPVEVRNDKPEPICGEISELWRCTKCGAEIVFPLSRTFIPARLDDNFFLNRDPKYRATLMALPEPMRSQLLYGDFNAEENDDPHQLIPTRWVQLAQERWLERERPQAPLSALGSDPARGGNDCTTTAPRIGNWFDYVDSVPGKETPTGRDVVNRLALVAGRYRVVHRVPVGMDVIGVGTSPLDFATELNIQVIAMNGSEAADDGAADRSGMLPFANKRAQWWWMFREALDPEKGEEIALPPDRELLVDLCSASYDVGLRGIKVEDKDDIRKKIGRSPDKGDAVVNAFVARPAIVGYQTVTTQTPTGHIASPIKSAWKSRKGL